MIIRRFTTFFFLSLVLYSGFSQTTESLANSESNAAFSTVTQFAGGIGMISLGIGREFSKRKLETQILLGYVPEKYAGKSLWIITGKQVYFPFRKQILSKFKREFYILPISFGVSVSIYNLPAQNADRFPFYLNSMMYNYFLGGKIQMKLKEDSSRFISFYYEVGSNYIETYTYYLNKSTVSVKDIINIGLGLTVNL